MTILVHDGSEGAEYNSYATLEAADAYHAARATTAWSAATDDAVREAALIRATDYLDATYSFDPRLGDTVHPLVSKATVVMAVYALADTLAAKAEREVVEEEKELAGVGKKRLKYSEKADLDPYPMVTKILAPLTGSTGNGIATGKIIK